MLTYGKLLGVLLGVVLHDVCCTWMCITVFGRLGWATLALMLFECVVVAIEAAHTLIKFGLYFYDLAQSGGWENKGHWMYYTVSQPHGGALSFRDARPPSTSPNSLSCLLVSRSS